MELQNQYQAFRDAGAEVVVAVVAPIEQVKNWCQAASVTYPMVADSEHQVSQAYGVYDLLGDGLATPSAFVIDTDSRIAWSRIGEQPAEYVAAQTILENLP